MPEPPPQAEILLWKTTVWRCEYWTVEGHGELRLFLGGEAVCRQALPPRDAYVIAQEWKAACSERNRP